MTKLSTRSLYLAGSLCIMNICRVSIIILYMYYMYIVLGPVHRAHLQMYK